MMNQISGYADLIGLGTLGEVKRKLRSERDAGRFAEWLREELCDLAPAEFEFGETIQEGHEWDIAVTCGDLRLRIELAYLEADFSHSAEWVVTIVPEASFNPFQRATADDTMLNALEHIVRTALENQRRHKVSIATPSSYVMIG